MAPRAHRRVRQRGHHRQLAPHQRLFVRHRDAASELVHGQDAELRNRALLDLRAGDAAGHVRDVVRGAERLHAGREPHHRAVRLERHHLTAHAHAWFELVRGEERLVHHATPGAHHADPVDGAAADHAAPNARVHFERLLELLDVPVARVADVAVAQGFQTVRVLELQQSAYILIHAAHCRRRAHETEGGQAVSGPEHDARGVRRARTFFRCVFRRLLVVLVVTPRRAVVDEVRPQREPDALGVGVHEQDARAAPLADAVRRGGIDRRAVDFLF